jgi:1-acyl-sn-glycerol-3-phosphate acyltransferase
MRLPDRSGHDITPWDAALTKRLVNAAAPIARRWFRLQVHGMEAIPSTGGVLVVSNHSGGMFTPDVLNFASAFYDTFGYNRPLLTLGHDALSAGPLGGWLGRIGVIKAAHENAVNALRSGAVVLTFPGGVFDAYRPTLSENTIDFNGRTGYVRTALEAGVPIVPSVSIGGQETQLFLTRGNRLAKRLGLIRFRADILPVTVGFPFGLSVLLPPNLPLPAKIVTQVLDPIDIAALFGANPDVAQVDSHIRAMMQKALDELARQRHLPVLG